VEPTITPKTRKMSAWLETALQEAKKIRIPMVLSYKEINPKGSLVMWHS
jgi:hypothetical protein